MTDCDRCGEHCLDCKCVELRLKDYFCCNGHQFNEDEIEKGRLCPFCEKEKGIKCHKDGCRSLETRCKDCGRVVNETILGLNDENKQSNPQNSTEIPTKEGNSGWIRVDDSRKPQDDQSVLIYHPNTGLFHRAFYDEETGLFFSLETFNSFPLCITHWMPLPEPPRENGMD